MAKVEGKQHILEQQICEVLGIDPAMVRSITLRFAAHEIAQATIVIFPDKDDLNRLLPIIKEYELVPKEHE